MSKVSPAVEEVRGAGTPEAVLAGLGPAEGVQLLRSNYFQMPQARYSFIVAEPFLIFQSFGSRCTLQTRNAVTESFGNPWHLLDQVMARYELLDEVDHPFPLGGCFGFWGYDLKNFVEPKLKRHALNDLEIPDAWIGFYSSVLVFDHHLDKVWIVSTGLDANGQRTEERCTLEISFWKRAILAGTRDQPAAEPLAFNPRSNMSRRDFVTAVQRAQEYIRLGHIYQVNLSQRLTATWNRCGWNFFQRLKEASPAPFSAYLHCGDFELASSSPELFLRMSGTQIQSRPIKGTRPRAADATRDAQLSYELQTSSKEISELVMITDLLRNDLGRVSEFGSVHVPDLVRLEKYPHVQHLVSTVEARLRPEVTHFQAFSSCFPGGSITGAPKFRAMEIIDELEPVSRGPYTGALGYLGFNRETQLSIIIRTALVRHGEVHFNVGAGIVADSNAEAEYDETLAKAGGFFEALKSACTEPSALSRSGRDHTFENS